MTWSAPTVIGQLFGDVPHVSGRFYDSRMHSTLTTLTTAANTLYAVPFYVPRTVTYTSITIEVTTLASGKSIRMGIYTDSSGVPNTLVLDAGTISTTTTGAKTITISQSLSAGWYWLAGVGDGTPGVRAASQTTALGSMGFTSGTDTTYHVGFSVAFTYAALPTPFTGGGTLMTTAAPRFMLGV